MKKIISVINQKGGVGKTTTSINFACGLAIEGYRVLLIDLDPQAHSTIGMGFNPGTYQDSISNVLLKQKNIRDVILETSVKNLSLLPSHIRLDRAEQLLTPEMFKEIRLAKALESLSSDFDFVIIDCRPTLGTLTINALYACNFIIVPMEMARYALEGFADLIETIDNVKNDKTADKGEFIRILFTKYDARKSVTIDWAIEQLKDYSDLVFNTKIRQNEALNQAQIAQEPIFTFKPSSNGAEDYKLLTNEFLRICQHQSEKN
jgi:chromosome partitioning protein